jgi:hypothetical protein
MIADALVPGQEPRMPTEAFMCGDLEDDTRLDDELFARLLASAKMHNASPDGRAGPQAGEPGSRAWMTRQYQTALSQALSEVAAAPEGAHADALGGQAIVLARLAGFLAGHLPAKTDIFRNLVDAMLDGHREPELRAAEHEHAHHHAHGGDHGHGHGH